MFAISRVADNLEARNSTSVLFAVKSLCGDLNHFDKDSNILIK